MNTTHKLETPASPPLEKDKSIYEIKDQSGKWIVKVIPNLYSAISLDNARSYGQQEIVIETPEHNVEFSQLSQSHIEQVLEAYRNRTTALKKLTGIRYVSVFKNDGPKAGASIAHAHSQIYALPFEPPDLKNEAEVVNAYFADNGTCPFCDIIAWEQRKNVRIIYEDKHFIAITPYCSRFGFEVWVIPKRHISSLRSTNNSELGSLAGVLKMVSAKLDSINLSFNFFLQDSLDEFDHHFVLKIEPRNSIWAGFEFSTGIIINQIAPEYAALWYKGRVK